MSDKIYEESPFTEYTEDYMGIECETCGKHFLEPGLCDNCFSKIIHEDLHVEIKRLQEALEAAEQNRAAVRREVLKEAARQTCWMCHENRELALTHEFYMHKTAEGYWTRCHAHAIYMLAADADQGQPEEPDSYTDRELKCTGCMGPCGRCDDADQGQAGKEG